MGTMKSNARKQHEQGQLFNYNSHIDETIIDLSKKYLGKFGIVGVADGIWDSGPVPGRPQGGPFSTCIFIYTTQPVLAKTVIPKQFNGYMVIVTKSDEINALGMYGQKL